MLLIRSWQLLSIGIVLGGCRFDTNIPIPDCAAKGDWQDERCAPVQGAGYSIAAAAARQALMVDGGMIESELPAVVSVEECGGEIVVTLVRCTYGVDIWFVRFDREGKLSRISWPG